VPTYSANECGKTNYYVRCVGYNADNVYTVWDVCCSILPDDVTCLNCCYPVDGNNVTSIPSSIPYTCFYFQTCTWTP
jgi:hypothetical protein